MGPNSNFLKTALGGWKCVWKKGGWGRGNLKKRLLGCQFAHPVKQPLSPNLQMFMPLYASQLYIAAALSLKQLICWLLYSPNCDVLAWWRNMNLYYHYIPSVASFLSGFKYLESPMTQEVIVPPCTLPVPPCATHPPVDMVSSQPWCCKKHSVLTVASETL